MFFKTMLCGLLLSGTLLSGCQKIMGQKIEENTEAAEVEPVVITRWTDKTELFVEFPPLVVGEESPFAAHLTDLETFQPVSSDLVVTTLTRKDGHTLTSRTPTPIIPGIYRPVITPDKPGVYRLTFHRSDPKDEKYSDTVDAGEVIVAATREIPLALEAEAGGSEITFLKEQQWVIDFTTEIITERILRETLKLHAEVEPASGGRVEIAAPIGGRIAPVLGGVLKWSGKSNSFFV